MRQLVVSGFLLVIAAVLAGASAVAGAGGQRAETRFKPLASWTFPYASLERERQTDFPLREKKLYELRVTGTGTVTEDGYTRKLDALYCFPGGTSGAWRCDPPVRFGSNWAWGPSFRTVGAQGGNCNDESSLCDLREFTVQNDGPSTNRFVYRGDHEYRARFRGRDAYVSLFLNRRRPDRNGPCSASGVTCSGALEVELYGPVPKIWFELAQRRAVSVIEFVTKGSGELNLSKRTKLPEEGSAFVASGTIRHEDKHLIEDDEKIVVRLEAGKVKDTLTGFVLDLFGDITYSSEKACRNGVAEFRVAEEGYVRTSFFNEQGKRCHASHRFSGSGVSVKIKER